MLPLSELTSRLLGSLPPPLDALKDITVPTTATVWASVCSLPYVGPYIAAFPLTSLFGTLLATLLAYAAYIYWSWFIYYPSQLPWRNLPGPPSKSLLWGNMLEFVYAPPSSAFYSWIQTYGPTVRYMVACGNARILTTDAAFVQAMFTDCETWHKPWEAQLFLRRILGKGLTAIEGAEHIRIRRVCLPAFSHRNVRLMGPAFFDKAEELRDIWLKYATRTEPEGWAEAAPFPPKPGDEAQGGRKIDVMKGVMAMAIDIIGLAGFGYQLHALSTLQGEDNKLVDAFRNMIQGGMPNTRLQMFLEMIPWFRGRTKAERTVEECAKLADSVLAERLRQSKAEVAAQLAAEKEGVATGTSGTEAKDLLSLMLRSNMNPDIKVNQRLTDYDIQSQLRTFMLAGNETSASSTCWALLRMAKAPEIQSRLRAECMTLGERPSIDALDALPFLDAVVREVLRTDAVVQASIRTAQRDTVIKLATPVRGRDGNMITEVLMRRGDSAFIPMQVMNWDPEVWGPDSLEFNPDRFLRPGIPAKTVPGVYGNIMTFITGRHGCIGWRFAVTEVKVVLFTLIRAFSFEELPSKPEVVGQLKVILRPAVKGEDEETTYQLPLLVRALDTA